MTKPRQKPRGLVSPNPQPQPSPYGSMAAVLSANQAPQRIDAPLGLGMPSMPEYGGAPRQPMPMKPQKLQLPAEMGVPGGEYQIQPYPGLPFGNDMRFAPGQNPQFGNDMRQVPQNLPFGNDMRKVPPGSY